MSNGEPSHILVVEDERHLAEGLKFNLEAEGYRASVAGDGETALEILETEARQVDAVVLDLMLPGQDGFSVVQTLRLRGDYTPVLILTARGRPDDVVRGFAAGADDYLSKPFDLSILLARLQSLLRRMQWQRRPDGNPRETALEPERAADPSANQFRFHDRVIDFAALELRTPSRTIRLTVMEADLLRYLTQRQSQIVSRKELLEQVWRVRQDTDTRAIDNFMVKLRRHIEDDPGRPVYLQTVRGVGYRFLPEG